MLGGAEVTTGEGYPGWKPNPSSPILKVAVDSYKKLFGVAESKKLFMPDWNAVCSWRNILRWIWFLSDRLCVEFIHRMNVC